MRHHFLALTAMLIISMMLLGPDSALAQVPACSDVFPQDITEDADPPDVFDLPPFPDPNDGDANWEDDFTLAGGTYYFESLDVDNNTEITLGGPVLIFVEGNVDIGNNVEINVGGDPSDFVLIGYQDIDIGNGAEINGIIYADDEIELENNVEITGAVTSTDDVDTDPNTEVTYDATAVENADFGGLCTNGNGGGGPGGAIFSYFMEEPDWTGAAGEVQDSSGNGLDATTVGAADTDDTMPAIPGDPGTCRYGDFSGGGRRVTAPSSALVNAADSFTIATWVRMPDDAQSNGTPSIMAYGNTVGGSWPERYELYLERNSWNGFSTPSWDTWVFVVRKANGNLSFHRMPVFFTAASNPLSDTWVHVVATYNSGNDRSTLYINGAQEDQITMSGPNSLNDASGGLGLMAHPGGQFDAQGFVDEVYMFGSVLDAAEVASLHQNTRPCDSGPDHIRLLHPATGLTCSPAEVTVQACEDSDCTALFPNPVEVDFTSPTAAWTPDPAVFTETATVTLQYTTPDIVTLDALAIDPAADNPTRCFSGGAETNCEMEFLESGFVIDVPDHVADARVSGSISAVKADPADPQQCVPGFDNETKDVGFWSDYVNPASGALSVGIDGNAIGTASPGTAIAIAFDGNGVGTFDLRYPDVGDVELNARHEGSGDEAGLIMIGEDRFIARPARFTLDIPGNPDPAATDHTGDVFTTAGTGFQVTVAALNASDAITPNFGNETPAEDVNLELALVEPAGGAEPALAGNFNPFGTDCDGNTATPGTSCGEFSWPEVGIVSLNPRLASGAYLGTSDVVGAAIEHVGRFIPDHFQLINPRLIDRAQIACSASPFTYIGERFDAEFSVLALSAGGIPTQNYRQDFAFLDTSQLNLSEATGPTLRVTNPSLDAWMAGSADARAELSIDRNDLEGPIENYMVAASPTDNDGVALQNPPAEVGSTELRFGRIVIDNAIGSELGPLDLHWRVEYWDGNTWLINELDDCTAMDLTNDVQLKDSSGNVTNGTATVPLGSETTDINVADSILTLGSGQGRFRFTAPDSPGFVDLILNLGDNWPFLQDDLEAPADVYEDSPQARASFGLFDGNSLRIYIREIPPQ